jgi:hypothetical protein
LTFGATHTHKREIGFTVGIGTGDHHAVLGHRINRHLDVVVDAGDVAWFIAIGDVFTFGIGESVCHKRHRYFIHNNTPAYTDGNIISNIAGYPGRNFLIVSSDTGGTTSPASAALVAIDITGPWR